MKVLFIGDVVGRPGRAALRECLGDYAGRVDLVIANSENAAGGNGLTFDVADEIFSYGVDVITMGNHVWDKREIFDFIDDNERIVRPINYPENVPGRGLCTLETRAGVKVAVFNACGRVFSSVLLNDPFLALKNAVADLKAETSVIIIDFHGEATSEKMALGHYLDGSVSAVLGTHTHVQTADARVLSGGTGYISDVGMTGPYDSVIGVKKEIVVKKFLDQLPARFEVATGAWQFCACLLEIDPATGLCVSIDPISRKQSK